MKRYEELLARLKWWENYYGNVNSFAFTPLKAGYLRDAAVAIRELQVSAEKAEAEIAEANRRAGEAEAELQRLREIVAKLPKTADGVPVIEGDTVWHRCWDGTVLEHTFQYQCTGKEEYYVATPGMLRCCYSSREAAARAAMEKGGGK